MPTAHWDEPASFTIKGNRRAGGYRVTRALRIEPGEITDDLDKLPGINDNIPSRAFRPLSGGSETRPVMSSIRHFRDQFTEHQKRGCRSFDPAASADWRQMTMTTASSTPAPRQR